jgi:hypothetical protein
MNLLQQWIQKVICEVNVIGKTEEPGNDKAGFYTLKW